MDPGELTVALFAYRRPDELAQTLDGLRGAGFRRITAFSDAPRSEEDRPLVEAVRELLAGVRWADLELVERDRHLGLMRSVCEGLDQAFARDERVVVIEDDIAVAPEFGRFVAAGLERYADEERVVGVTGHRMPFSRRWLRGHPYDAFMLPRLLSWGWAGWRRAWSTFDFDPERLLQRLRSEPVRPELGGADLAWMLRKSLVEGTLLEAWDVYCSANMLLDDQLFVGPTWNMIENRGLATGVHPQWPAWTLRFETEHRPADLDRLRWPPVVTSRRVTKGIRIFTENPGPWRLRRLVPRPLRNVLRKIRGTYKV